MVSFLKKLFGSKEKDVSDDTVVLSEPDLTIARANNEMQLRTQAAVDMWGLDTASWAVDLDSGTLTFINDEKEMVITAPVQVVGTYNTEDGTWLWGWDHPSVTEPLGEFARRVRNFGEQYGREKLTTRKIAASIDDVWEFTALACHLGGGEGGYSGLSGSTRVLMVYGPVTISKKD
ncbi:DUF6882 domain-containing protein [Leminorella grimontii]|uniref:DUF6882 domain-containing protein n=1 Tax=Leminorella grimontii TaxID=82981 RepID=UPI0020864128|nr:DUF6882 domain-containing protein [Leminorella grimontii]GKX60500.1 hypothetical protein SOASR031_28150 [Leminorella grimontii]